MLNIIQSIDGLATDASLSSQLSNPTEKKNTRGAKRSQCPIQLTLPNFAPMQCSEISAKRKAKNPKELALKKDSAQQLSPDQRQLSFQFFSCNLSIGAER